MIKISIIGFGSIGKFVFKKLSEKNIKIQSLICKPGREEIAKKALKVASEICVFTNNNITMEKL